MPPSRRMLRINQLLREEIADVLHRDVKDELFQWSLLSITEVETAPDLRHAKVYFSVYGDEDQAHEMEVRLNRAARFLRKGLMDRLDLKLVPYLEFTFDRSLARGDRVMQLMRGIERSREEQPPDGTAGD